MNLKIIAAAAIAVTGLFSANESQAARFDSSRIYELEFQSNSGNIVGSGNFSVSEYPFERTFSVDIPGDPVDEQRRITAEDDYHEVTGSATINGETYSLNNQFIKDPGSRNGIFDGQRHILYGDGRSGVLGFQGFDTGWLSGSNVNFLYTNSDREFTASTSRGSTFGEYEIYRATTVPEPSTYAGIVLGGSFLAYKLLQRRRRSS